MQPPHDKDASVYFSSIRIEEHKVCVCVCVCVCVPVWGCSASVPLRTGTSYIRDIFVLFLQDYCALQELLMKMNFTIAVAPPFVHPMTSLPATPTHSVKYGNLKRCESLSFSGDIESLEPSKFQPYRLLIAGIVSEL